MHGIIVEGTSGIGKTTALRRLRRYIAEEYPNTNELFIVERYTYQTLDRKKNRAGLTDADVERHIRTITDTIRPYDTLMNDADFPVDSDKVYAVTLLERTVLTHCVYMNIDPRVFEKHFLEMAELGLTLVILVLPEELIDERMKTAHRERTDPNWVSHVESLGGLSATTTYYVQWQRTLQDYAKSIEHLIPVSYVDLSEEPNRVDEILRELALAGSHSGRKRVNSSDI